ncbi:MAG: Amidase enhancer [Chlamydiae bacterium]|nr:Amidase enhancer [Chlamydiota bacterium]
MIKRILALLLLSTALFALDNSDISQQNKPVTVRVLLKKLARSALVEVKGRHFVYNPKTDQLIFSGAKNRRARMSTADRGLSWGGRFPGLFEIRIVPGDPTSAIFIDGIQYKGCIEIYSIGGTLNIVNEIDTENYLKSILSHQLNPVKSQEALDAVVITERTNLHYTIAKDPFASWQVDAMKVGYFGLGVKKSQQVYNAVERTRDMVMHYKKQPFASSWSSNNAGKSVSYIDIFRNAGNTPKGVNGLPSSIARQTSRWTAFAPLKTFSQLTGLKRITKIDLFCTKGSTKVYGMRIYSRASYVDLDFFKLQKALGKELLKSNDFAIEIKGKKLLFIGYGEGAGVGLCLKSAELLSEKKESTEEILTFHFPGTELINPRREGGYREVENFIWR